MIISKHVIIVITVSLLKMSNLEEKTKEKHAKLNNVACNVAR